MGGMGLNLGVVLLVDLLPHWRNLQNDIRSRDAQMHHCYFSLKKAGILVEFPDSTSTCPPYFRLYLR